MHYGLAADRHLARALVLRRADGATPERFVRQVPVPPALPTAAWINPPKLLVAAPASEDVRQ
jgi:putative transposase